MADWIVKKDGEVINTITASEDFAKSYAEKHGYEIEERIIEQLIENLQPTLEEQVIALKAAVEMLCMEDMEV